MLNLALATAHPTLPLTLTYNDLFNVLLNLQRIGEKAEKEGVDEDKVKKEKVEKERVDLYRNGQKMIEGTVKNRPNLNTQNMLEMLEQMNRFYVSTGIQKLL